MYRLTFALDARDDDPAAWAERVRGAVPRRMHLVAAYLDATSLVAYVDISNETDAADAFHEISETLDLPGCDLTHVLAIDPAFSALSRNVAPRRPAANAREGRIVSVEVSPDGRKVSARVRHAQYEYVDRVEAIESSDSVRLVAWVASAHDDPRADYVTLAHTFTDVLADLDAPLGGRRIDYDNV